MARGLTVGLSEHSWSIGLRVGLITAILGVLVLALLMKLRRHARDEIRPLARWKWVAHRAVIGVALALTVGIVIGAAFDWARGLAFGLVLALILALTFGVHLSSGLEVKAYPNQSIRKSAIIALCAALLGALVGLIGFGTVYGAAFDLRQGIVNSILGLTLAVVSLEFGAMPLMQHLGLRLILAAYERMPLNLIHFLKAACKLHLMRKVDGGYMFQHEYLRHYFRELPRVKAGRGH